MKKEERSISYSKENYPENKDMRLQCEQHFEAGWEACEKEQENNRRIVAEANFCRSFLGLYNFVTDSECERIHKRILKWQSENKVYITEEQLDSVTINYKD